ncbi:carboxypeptidase regulatory-like domain-containing protein [Duganella sp. FT134W]|uniref:Carboxypeptidase regulatory-like domain-containing protein n=1 Tax=Duganella margarita TaxID=2692170 RepID=A0A7X4H7K7_9BURK|nr:carboxypeptidase regulatory-like domain-containing protein [Duganella margarita]MYM76276.1 carboxypeptidase regulatory-like domain-containing protein [Duganella margarita]
MKSIITLTLTVGLLRLGTAAAQDAAAAGCEGSSGIGADERASMAAAQSGHNLRLTFATKGSGEYLANVAVTVSDPAGRPLASFVSPGPLCDLHLAPGRYRVSATAHGDTLSRIAQVRQHGARELYFYWDPH